MNSIKIAAISDIHGNATALEAVLSAIKSEGIEEIINLGDAIAIGPDPERVLGILVAQRIPSLCGNHEQYFLEGTHAFPELEEGEKLHQDWIRDQLSQPYIPVVSEFPLQQVWFSHGRQITFIHYAMMQNDRGLTRFKPAILPQTLDVVRHLFSDYAQENGVTIFGHSHEPCHIVDPLTHHHYINPGSLGCTASNMARYAVVEISDQRVSVELKEVKYNKAQVLDRLFAREVPQRDVILKQFYT